MRLVDLEPNFVRYETRIENYKHQTKDGKVEEVNGPREYKIVVRELKDAQGISFLCPKCVKTKPGRRGVHRCEATFENSGAKPHQGSQNENDQPVRWAAKGTGFSDLTLSPSIQLEGGCEWHGFINGGAVTNA